MPPIPVPTLDHIVVNARDRLDAAAEAYRRLGFTLTPRGFHTLGSANHLAMFGTDYLELIGVPSADAPRQEIMRDGFGLNGLVFLAEDADATHAALDAQGVPCTPPNRFSRPVVLPEGARDAVFRTVHVQPPGAIRPGRLYFCQHLTRDLVWRDEWRHHPNGAVGIARFVIAADDPPALGALFAQMFGEGALHAVAGGLALVAGLSRIDVLDHAAVAARFGGAAADPLGRGTFMAGLTLRTRSLAQARAALRQGGVAAIEQDGRLLTRAADGMNCPLEFVA